MMNLFFFLTQTTTPIIAPIAKLFGMIMNGIYDFFLNYLSVKSLGISIIIFTIIIRMLLIPLAVKQQKAMKDMQKIQPQLKALQEKYKNKKDPESQKQFQAESAKLYQEHNVNPFGGCLPLLIQLPIMFALFAVLRNIPAYIVKVKAEYLNIYTKISTLPGYDATMQNLFDNFPKAKTGTIKSFSPDVSNKVVDFLATFNQNQWDTLKGSFQSVADQLTPIINKIADMNTFLGINLTDKPVSLDNGIQGLLTVGILIPILTFIFQILISRTTPSTSNGDKAQDQTQKTMMLMMPLISLIFVVQMPAGLGLYWLVGNVFQLIQQIIINNHLRDKVK